MGREELQGLKRALRARLGKRAFQPVTNRLTWFACHWLIVGSGIGAIYYSLGAGWPLWSLLPFSLVIGLSFAGLAFVAHETLHGAVTRSQKLRYWLGFFSFLPFCISPRLWTAWHNRTHHAQTNRGPEDPDAYPRLREYEEKSGVRFSVVLGAPRSGKWRGLITLLLGLTIQSLMVLKSARRRNYLRQRNYRLALVESIVAWSFWLLCGSLLGVSTFILGFLLPLVVGNAIVMSFIVTNHALNSLGTHKNPLENSLSVTADAGSSWPQSQTSE